MTRRPAAAAAVLAAVACLLFHDTILGRAVYWGSDISEYYFPVHALLGDCLRRSDFGPLLWSPSLQSGFPILAEGQVGAYYPLNWLTLLVLPPLVSLNACIVLSYLGAALATCWFLRSIGASWGGSLIAGVAFAFGGFAVGHVVHVSVLETVPWLPIVLTLIEKGGAEAKPRWLVAAGLAWALQLFAGHPQVPLMTLLLAAAYAGWRTLDAPAAPPLLRARRAVVAAATFVVVGLSAAAIHLLPLFELMGQSDRAGGQIPYAVAASYALPPAHLVTAVLPFAFGGPPDFRGPWAFAELSFYVGIPTLLLAVAACGARSRRRPAVFFAAVVGVSLLLALGDATPAFRLLHAMPGFGGFRAPARFVFLVDFGLAVLAGVGFDVVAASEGGSWRRRLAGVGLAGAAALGATALIWPALGLRAAGLFAVSAAWLVLAGRLPRRVWAGAGLLLLVADLHGFVARCHASSLVPPALPTWHAPALDWVASQPRAGRIYVVNSDTPWIHDTNQPLDYGLDELGGYSALYVRSLRRYLQTFWWTGQSRRVLLSLASVRYVVDRWEAPQAPSRTWHDVTFRLNHPLSLVGDGAARTISYRFDATPTRALAYVSRLEGSALARGVPAARLTLVADDGREVTVPVRAGIETAERIEPDGPEAAYLGTAMDGLAQVELLYGHTDVEPVRLVGLRIDCVAPRGRLWLQGLSLVGLDGSARPVLPFMEEGYRVVFRANHVTVYENTETLPRAYVAHEVRQASDAQAAFDALLAPDFRPGASVVLEDPNAPRPSGSGPSSVRIESDRPTEVQIAASLGGDGYVVLNDVDYPGWRAFVDGRPVRIHRANTVFRAVFVPSGEHRVVFAYRSTWLGLGAAWTSLTLVGCGLGLRAGRRLRA